MIILAYYGTGKTYFCNKYLNTIDLESQPVILDEHKNFRDDTELFCSQMFSLSFHFFRTVVSQSTLQVREFLNAHNIPYVVVLPNLFAQKEYESRWINRGDNNVDIKKRLNSWNYFVGSQLPNEKIVRLKENQYLEDALDDIYNLYSEQLNYFDFFALNKVFSQQDITLNYAKELVNVLFEECNGDTRLSTRTKELEIIKSALQKS